MSFKLLEGHPVSYIDWKVDYYKRFHNKGLRLGQHFCNTFIKNGSNVPNYHSLYNACCEERAEHIIAIFINTYHWNLEELVIVRDY